MYHGKAGRKLGRTSSHREAMFRNMVASIIRHERIRTTDAKAKEIKKITEKMITLGKKGDLHARRQALSFVRDKEMVSKLFGELSERYRDRSGGYTRIVKVGYRVGDNAPISILELLSEEKKKEKVETKGKTKTKAKKTVEKTSDDKVKKVSSKSKLKAKTQENDSNQAESEKNQ